MAKLVAVLATAILLLGACTDTGPERIETPNPTSSSVAATPATTASSDVDEASFLAVTKAGFRGIPDLPETTDIELVSFGYEICDRLESATSSGVDPKEAAEKEVDEARLSDGQIAEGKGDVLILRITLQKAASEFLCSNPTYQEWADGFEEGVLQALQGDGANG